MLLNRPLAVPGAGSRAGFGIFMGSGSFFQATKGGRDEADAVAELFVPEAAKSEAVQKAESLPKLDITELDLQWVQVRKL